MRAIAMLVILGCASMAAAQCVAPASNSFDQSAAGNCTAITTCKATLATCQASATCSNVATCYSNYVTCLMAITASRTNSSDPCMTYGNGLYIAQLAAAASSSLNGTVLLGSCNFLVCGLQNSSSLKCSNLTSTVCTSANLLASTAPVTTSFSTAASTAGPDIVVTLRISGGNWSAILNDPVKLAAATSALTNDIAKLLGVDAKFVKIVSLTLGSLIVVFQVLQGSGKSPAALQSLVQTATASTAWLTGTQGVYSTVSSETLTVLGVTVTATGAPTTLAPGQTYAPTTKPSSAMGAAGVWAVAAVAAIAALFA